MSRLWNLSKDVFWLAVAIALVAGGVIGFQFLGANKTIVEAQPATRPVSLVATEPLELFAGPLPIRGEGFVEAFREVALSAQVVGRIESLHPAIERRGDFSSVTEAETQLAAARRHDGARCVDDAQAGERGALQITQQRLQGLADFRGFGIRAGVRRPARWHG